MIPRRTDSENPLGDRALVYVSTDDGGTLVQDRLFVIGSFAPGPQFALSGQMPRVLVVIQDLTTEPVTL